jgi:hypothetical protein
MPFAPMFMCSVLIKKTNLYLLIPPPPSLSPLTPNPPTALQFFFPFKKISLVLSLSKHLCIVLWPLHAPLATSHSLAPTTELLHSCEPRPHTVSISNNWPLNSPITSQADCIYRVCYIYICTDRRLLSFKMMINKLFLYFICTELQLKNTHTQHTRK